METTVTFGCKGVQRQFDKLLTRQIGMQI